MERREALSNFDGETPGAWPALSAADAAAVDALLEAGLSGTVGAERGSGDARSAAVCRLLGRLETMPERADAATLVAVTLARVEREARAGVSARSGGAERVALTPVDEEAVDAFVLAGGEAGGVASALRPRAQAVARQRDVVTRTRVVEEREAASRAARVERTLALIDEESEAPTPAVLRFPGNARAGGFRLADLVSVAAVLLIAASIVWPVLANVRHRGMMTACQTNLASVGRAMGAYALDNRLNMPVAAASFGGAWWNVGAGPGRSNSANLYTLARQQYAALAQLACPGNPGAPTVETRRDASDWKTLEEVSYSYQIMFGQHRPAWNAPRMVVISDRSPVVLRAVRRELINPWENSPNHAGRGQDVMFTDGSVEWVDSPIVAEDNIWLPREIEEAIRRAQRAGRVDPIDGTETPSSQADSFVGP